MQKIIATRRIITKLEGSGNFCSFCNFCNFCKGRESRGGGKGAERAGAQFLCRRTPLHPAACNVLEPCNYCHCRNFCNFRNFCNCRNCRNCRDCRNLACCTRSHAGRTENTALHCRVAMLQSCKANFAALQRCQHGVFVGPPWNTSGCLPHFSPWHWGEPCAPVQNSRLQCENTCLCGPQLVRCVACLYAKGTRRCGFRLHTC
jgi:hypothetical protein